MTMTGKLQLLLLEDRPTDAELVMRHLREDGIQFEAKCVASEAEFLAQLRDNPPDIILADYSLPAYDGLSALAAVRKERAEIPFIFVSGTLGEETAIEAVQHGATDYVLKQRLSRLGPAVRRALREIEEHQGRARAEKHIRELNLLLRAIRAISQLIVRERDPRKLLAEACNILVQTRSYSLAWIGLTEAGSKRVVPAACAGERTDYLDQVRITWDETATGRGPTGTAMRTGQPWVCQDTATDPRFAPWREIALARGYVSVAAVPMRHGARTLGAVTVCSNRKDSLHEEEVALLKELADDLAFALQSIEDEIERRGAEARLRLLGLALESAANAIVITDRAGIIIWANPAFTQLTGYSLEEALGRKTSLVKSDVHDQAFYQGLWQTVLAGHVWSAEMNNRRKDGSLYTEQNTITPVRLESGEITHFIAVKEDVTDRRRAAAEREGMIQELQAALSRVKLLSGLLPICSNCKRIRDDQGSWSQVEAYISSHSDTTFTHGICPECLHRLYPEVEQQVLRRTSRIERPKEE
jgi:PAS domain S-box-containing protein